MKTEKEIQERLNWLVNALDDADNKTQLQQAKLYAQIDFIKWLGVTPMAQDEVEQFDEDYVIRQAESFGY